MDACSYLNACTSDILHYNMVYSRRVNYDIIQKVWEEMIKKAQGNRCGASSSLHYFLLSFPLVNNGTMEQLISPSYHSLTTQATNPINIQAQLSTQTQLKALRITKDGSTNKRSELELTESSANGSIFDRERRFRACPVASLAKNSKLPSLTRLPIASQ